MAALVCAQAVAGVIPIAISVSARRSRALRRLAAVLEVFPRDIVSILSFLQQHPAAAFL
nr:hypothetical protein [Halomonas sp.]